MKKQFSLSDRTPLEHGSTGQSAASRERVYRHIGRILLLGAVFSGGLEMIFSVILGSRIVVTLHAMLGLAPPEMTGSVLAPIDLPIRLALDLPLWIVLLIAAAIPYAMALYQSSKEQPPSR